MILLVMTHDVNLNSIFISEWDMIKYLTSVNENPYLRLFFIINCSMNQVSKLDTTLLFLLSYVLHQNVKLADMMFFCYLSRDLNPN